MTKSTTIEAVLDKLVKDDAMGYCNETKQASLVYVIESLAELGLGLETIIEYEN